VGHANDGTHARLRDSQGSTRGTASSPNDGVSCLDCVSRRAFGPTKTIRGIFWTQLGHANDGTQASLDSQGITRGTASSSNDGVLCLDCDSRRAFGPTKTIRGIFWTQLNRLERLAALSAIRERSF
jgi:hypothetical protein